MDAVGDILSHGSDVARGRQRCVESLLEEGARLLEVLAGGHLGPLLLVGQVVAEVVPAGRVFEDGVGIALLPRTDALLALALEAGVFVGAWARNFRALQLFFNVIKAGLSGVKCWLRHVL